MPSTIDAGRKKRRQSGLMALAGDTAKMAQNMMVLDKTEAALERELAKEEKRKPPTTKVAKARYKGERVLHAKYLLLAVVILNVVDCLLVLGELMLDIKYVTDLLSKEYDRSEEFIGSMKGLYPDQLRNIDKSDIETLEHELLKATITWASSQDGIAEVGRQKRADVRVTSSGNTTGNETGHPVAHHESHHAHSIEEEIAHGLHKASITILGILVVETLFKVFCLGREMLEHKLECFDGVIVIASFIVDLVFLKGLQQFTVQEFVLILAFMVPWRIIRVVNSLVVAIMDHEHFRLKLLYQQKKKISGELKDAKDEIKGLEACVDALEKMAGTTGDGEFSEMHVRSKLNLYKRLKTKNDPMGALGSFAVSGGGNMSKPLPAARYPTSTVSLISETSDKSATARRFEELLRQRPGSSVTELVASMVAERQGLLPENRPRSRSALDPISHLETLAGNSASFIATMNKDDLSKDTLKMLSDHAKSTSQEFRKPEKVHEVDEKSNSSTRDLINENVDETLSCDNTCIDIDD